MLNTSQPTHPPTVTKPRPIRTATEHTIEVPRTARYYEMGSAVGADLWIVLHGFGQLAGDFIEYFAELNDGSRIIVAPEALSRYYTASLAVPSAERPVGATWMTREDRESEISDYVEYLDALCDEIASSRSVPVNVLGFSQGAATATRWLTNGRSRIERLVLWGGITPPETDLVHAGPRLRDARVTLVFGTRDHYISDEIVATERNRLETAGIGCEVIRFDGGHVISRSVFPRLLGDRISDASDR